MILFDEQKLSSFQRFTKTQLYSRVLWPTSKLSRRLRNAKEEVLYGIATVVIGVALFIYGILGSPTAYCGNNIGSPCMAGDRAYPAFGIVIALMGASLIVLGELAFRREKGRAAHEERTRNIPRNVAIAGLFFVLLGISGILFGIVFIWAEMIGALFFTIATIDWVESTGKFHEISSLVPKRLSGGSFALLLTGLLSAMIITLLGMLYLESIFNASFVNVILGIVAVVLLILVFFGAAELGLRYRGYKESVRYEQRESSQSMREQKGILVTGVILFVIGFALSVVACSGAACSNETQGAVAGLLLISSFVLIPLSIAWLLYARRRWRHLESQVIK